MHVSGQCDVDYAGQDKIYFSHGVLAPLSHVFIVVSIPTLATVLKSCLGRSAPEEMVAVRAKERSVRSKRAMAPVQRVYSVRINLVKIKEI